MLRVPWISADRTSDTGQTPAPEPLSAFQAAAWLGVNERTVRRAIARGALAADNQGSVYRITRVDLEHYQAARPRGNRSPPHATPVNPYPLHLIGAPSRLLLRPLPRHDHEPVADLPRPLTPLIGRERETADLR